MWIVWGLWMEKVKIVKKLSGLYSSITADFLSYEKISLLLKIGNSVASLANKFLVAS